MLPPTWTTRYPSQMASAPPPESHNFSSSKTRPLPCPLSNYTHQPPSILHSQSPAAVTPVNSDSDLPEVHDIMQPSSKALGKRKARDNLDELEPQVKKCAWVEENQDMGKRRGLKGRMAGPSKAKIKAEPGSKTKPKGRAAGSHNFSAEEVHRLLHCINKQLPIGSKGWAAVAETYNSWEIKQGHLQCTTQSIKGKFDTVCNLRNICWLEKLMAGGHCYRSSKMSKRSWQGTQNAVTMILIQ